MAFYKKRHTVYVMDRGGKRRLFALKNISALSWNRVRDDKSQAQITITNEGARSQMKNLNKIDAARHEIVIFRDGIREWEGPIRLVTFQADSVVINANDIGDYLDSRALHAAYDNTYGSPTGVDYVVNRIVGIIRAELQHKEDLGYNILSYLHGDVRVGDARTAMATTPYSMTVWGHLDSLADSSGIDYTVVGRALYIWDTSNPIFGTTPPASEKDFLGPLTVSMYGSEMATVAISTDGQGTYGISGQDDPYYGERERLVQAYDASTATANQTAPTSAELQSQAERNLVGRNPTPVIVRVPDNSSINPEGVLKLERLVPGVWIPVRATINGKSISQVQKLQAVTVTEAAEGETITVSLYAATATAVTADVGGAA